MNIIKFLAMLFKKFESIPAMKFKGIMWLGVYVHTNNRKASKIKSVPSPAGTTEEV
jgi:hypothetical protein